MVPTLICTVGCTGGVRHRYRVKCGRAACCRRIAWSTGVRWMRGVALGSLWRKIWGVIVSAMPSCVTSY